MSSQDSKHETKHEYEPEKIKIILKIIKNSIIENNQNNKDINIENFLNFIKPLNCVYNNGYECLKINLEVLSFDSWDEFIADIISIDVNSQLKMCFEDDDITRKSEFIRVIELLAKIYHQSGTNMETKTFDVIKYGIFNPVEYLQQFLYNISIDKHGYWIIFLLKDNIVTFLCKDKFKGLNTIKLVKDHLCKKFLMFYSYNIDDIKVGYYDDNKDRFIEVKKSLKLGHYLAKYGCKSICLKICSNQSKAIYPDWLS